jgi:hypothetical protein
MIDECCFITDGIQNFHTIHIGLTSTLTSFTKAAGIIGIHLIGPFVLPTRPTGENFFNFLNLLCLSEESPLEIPRIMWFMHDGVPAHFTLNVRYFLNVSYGP